MSTTVHEICQHFDSVVDPQGWTKKTLTQRGDCSFEAEVEYAEGDPRKWVLVSPDGFATLANVRVYELLASPKMSVEVNGPWICRFWRRLVG
jgi:hypothetical protein